MDAWMHGCMDAWMLSQVQSVSQSQTHRSHRLSVLHYCISASLWSASSFCWQCCCLVCLPLQPSYIWVPFVWLIPVIVTSIPKVAWLSLVWAPTWPLLRTLAATHRTTMASFESHVHLPTRLKLSGLKLIYMGMISTPPGQYAHRRMHSLTRAPWILIGMVRILLFVLGWEIQLKGTELRTFGFRTFVLNMWPDHHPHPHPLPVLVLIEAVVSPHIPSPGWSSLCPLQVWSWSICGKHTISTILPYYIQFIDSAVIQFQYSCHRSVFYIASYSLLLRI